MPHLSFDSVSGNLWTASAGKLSLRNVRPAYSSDQCMCCKGGLLSGTTKITAEELSFCEHNSTVGTHQYASSEALLSAKKISRTVCLAL